MSTHHVAEFFYSDESHPMYVGVAGGSGPIDGWLARDLAIINLRHYVTISDGEADNLSREGKITLEHGLRVGSKVTVRECSCEKVFSHIEHCPAMYSVRN